MTTNTHKRSIHHSASFRHEKVHTNKNPKRSEKSQWFCTPFPLLKKTTSKTNAVVKLHLSSFSIVLLPRLCTWSLNTKKTSEQQKTAEGWKKYCGNLLTRFFLLELTHQATTQWPTKQSVESSLIWRWYVWLYFQRCRWILGHYNYSRQIPLAPNIQIFPKAKQETEGELYIYDYLCNTIDLGEFSTSSSYKSIHKNIMLCSWEKGWDGAWNQPGDSQWDQKSEQIWPGNYINLFGIWSESKSFTWL